MKHAPTANTLSRRQPAAFCFVYADVRSALMTSCVPQASMMSRTSK